MVRRVEYGSFLKLNLMTLLLMLFFFALDELRQAIRVLFDASVANMSDEEAIAITENWQHHGTRHIHHIFTFILILLSIMEFLRCNLTLKRKR